MATKRATRARKQDYHHGNLKQALLDAAVAAISQVGTEGLTLKQLALSLGVSHTAPYRHFKDKQALLAAVTAAGFARLLEHMQRAHARSPDDARQQFLDTGHSVVEFAVQQPGYFRAMFSGSAGNTLAELARPPEGSAFQVFVAYIEAWQARGLLRRGKTLPLALSIWSSTHGLACLCSSRLLRTRTRSELRALVDRTHSSLLEGVGS
jgi:AcrR family transcriptional regulator